MEKLKVVVSKLGSVDEAQYSRVVMVAKMGDKYILSKHKERDTWELPGGHVEEGENWLETAKRELYEETGATEAEFTPVCVYKVSKPGLLCFADVKKLGDIPDFEIERIEFFDDLPKNLTYPEIHKTLFKEAKRFEKGRV